MKLRINVLLCTLLVTVFAGHLVYAGQPERIGVAVTIPPYAEFVRQVGGDRVIVQVMVPSGASPHTYEPKPRQLRQLQLAELYVKTGTGIDFELAWMDKLLQLNPNLKVCDTSRGVPLLRAEDREEDHESRLESSHGHAASGVDPHVWLAPSNAITIVRNIRDCLISLDPSHAEAYRSNAAQYIHRLRELESQLSRQLEDNRQKSFIVFHPSWAYFAKEFGLTQIPVEEGGSEPSPRGIAQLISYARKNDIHVIFTSPQFNQKSARTIAHEIDGRVISIDPLAEDYIDNLQKVAEAFGETDNGSSSNDT